MGPWEVSVPGLKVTAFGAFGVFASNPSLELARAVFADVEEIEVSYRAVDAWILDQRDTDWTALLALGVDAKASVPRIETLGRNVVGAAADVTGTVATASVIDPDGPRTVSATLWNPECFRDPEGWTDGDDAGTYLCNYLLYRSLRAFPDRKTGFLHVPPFDTLSIEEQSETLVRLVAVLAPTLSVRSRD